MRLPAILAMLLFASSTARAEWHKSETRHFTIYSEGPELALRMFSTKVERFDKVIRKQFHVSDEDAPQKLTIFMLPTQAVVAKATAAGKDVAGMYIPNGEGSIAIVNRAGGNGRFDLDADAVLFHEYAHHFMLRYFPSAYPTWYIEGFAEFLAPTDFTKEGFLKLGIPPMYRAYGLVKEAAIPAETLLTSTVQDIPQDQRDAFYGRSWLLTHYLNFSKPRSGQLAKYLAALNAGATNIEAARLAFGDLKLLDEELKLYLEKDKINYLQDTVATAAPTDIIITKVSRGAGATMMQYLTLRRGPDETELHILTAAFRRAAQSYPQDPEPLTLLAEAEYKIGDDAATIQAADAALALDPSISRAMLFKGKAMLRQNIRNAVVDPQRWKDARSWIVKANRADVNDPMPLFAYYESFRQQGLQPSQSAFLGLARAFQMVPEDSEVRIAYALALARDKKFAPAIRLVEMLAFDPHIGPGSSEARLLLKRLHAAQDDKDGGDRDIFDDETENKSDK